MYGLKKSIDFTGGAKVEFSYASTTTVVSQEANTNFSCYATFTEMQIKYS
jgi:preprotein translocase subunit SecF